MDMDDLENLANDLLSLTRAGNPEAFEFVIPIIIRRLLEKPNLINAPLN